MKDAELLVKVPEKLEKRMEKFKWVNWPEVAVRTFSERVEDLEKMELEKKVAEISEISPDDKREIKESLVKEVENSCRKTAEDFRAGRIKAMTAEEFNKKYA